MNTTDAIFDLQQICLLLQCAMVCLVFQRISSSFNCNFWYFWHVWLSETIQSILLYMPVQYTTDFALFAFFFIPMSPWGVYWRISGCNVLGINRRDAVSKTSFLDEMLSLIDNYRRIDSRIRWRFYLVTLLRQHLKLLAFIVLVFNHF